MKPGARPELSWTRADYAAAGVEPPDELTEEGVSEGEVMDDDAAQQWFLDTIKVLRILEENDPTVFQRLYDGFILDVKYLVGLGKLDPETVEYVEKQENLRWMQ